MKSFKYLFLLLLVTAIYSCKKKEDFSFDDRITSLQFSNSNTRIINLSGLDQININGKKLTSYIFPQQGQLIPSVGSFYFPTNGRFTNGSVYTLPQTMIKSDGTASVKMDLLATLFGGALTNGQDSVILTTSFKTKDNLTNPNDYFVAYWHGTSFGATSDTVFTFPRAVSAPADPTHIKIRVVNIADQTGVFSNLTGPLTLTYADGSIVSPVTSNVKFGTSSAYIELPYGTYQFKLQTQNGAEMPCANFNNSGNNAIPANLVDPGTGIAVDGNNNLLNTVTVPINSYEPGGIYTVVASINGNFAPYYNEGSLFINSFRVINDISVPTNLTYARMGAVNTIAGSQVTVQVDGKSMGPSLAFGTKADYQIYVKGTHDVKAVDQSGKVLAEKSITMVGNDAWTAWVYAINGKADISFASDNLSGNFYSPPPGSDNQTGATSVVHADELTSARFLNFCQDLPYATFTDQNGQPLQQNLAPGQVVTTNVYSTVPLVTRTYQSQLSPLVVPGNWLSNITALQATDYIANKAIYSKGNFTGLPTTPEPGVYTVALIGSLSGSAATNQNAHLIIIKHNK